MKEFASPTVKYRVGDILVCDGFWRYEIISVDQEKLRLRRDNIEHDQYIKSLRRDLIIIRKHNNFSKYKERFKNACT
jgi:hypothetical protein